MITAVIAAAIAILVIGGPAFFVIDFLDARRPVTELPRAIVRRHR